MHKDRGRICDWDGDFVEGRVQVLVRAEVSVSERCMCKMKEEGGIFLLKVWLLVNWS